MTSRISLRTLTTVEAGTEDGHTIWARNMSLKKEHLQGNELYINHCVRARTYIHTDVASGFLLRLLWFLCVLTMLWSDYKSIVVCICACVWCVRDVWYFFQ